MTSPNFLHVEFVLVVSTSPPRQTLQTSRSATICSSIRPKTRSSRRVRRTISTSLLFTPTWRIYQLRHKDIGPPPKIRPQPAARLLSKRNFPNPRAVRVRPVPQQASRTCYLHLQWAASRRQPRAHASLTKSHTSWHKA